MSWLKLMEIFHFSDNFLQRVVNWSSCASILAPLGINTSWELENKATFSKSCLPSFFQSNSRCGTGEDPGKGPLSLSPICQTQPPLLENSWTMQSLSVRFQKTLSTPKKMWIKNNDLDSLRVMCCLILMNGGYLSCLKSAGMSHHTPACALSYLNI